MEDLAVFSESTAVMSARSSVDGPRMSLSRKLLGKIARHSQVYRCVCISYNMALVYSARHPRAREGGINRNIPTRHVIIDLLPIMTSNSQ